MSETRDWRRTWWWRAAKFIGSIKLAVPVLVLATAGMIVGTYLESKYGPAVAGRLVYDSTWFAAAMAIMCVSLIFAMFVRIPWRRTHLGFVTVHIGLVVLIVGGFTSRYLRQDGSITLREGTEAHQIEMDARQVQRIALDGHQWTTLESLPLADSAKRITLAGQTLRVVDRWPNAEQHAIMLDDGPTPRHAVQVALGSTHGQMYWLMESATGEQAAEYGDITLHVLPVDADEKLIAELTTIAPDVNDDKPAAEAFFERDGQQYPVTQPGDEVMPGWRIESAAFFRSAHVGANGLEETPGGNPNPAYQVVLTDGQGTVERHYAFANFPGHMPSRTLQGDAHSDAILRIAASAHRLQTGRRLVIMRTADGKLRTILVGADGSVDDRVYDAPLPQPIDLGDGQLIAVQQITHAQQHEQWHAAPAEDSSLPLLVLQATGQAEPIYLPWRRPIPVTVGDQTITLEYGPVMIDLPFAIRLDDFRRIDYPGSSVPMAFESDISVRQGDGPWTPFSIYMNHPYEYEGWKVYQATHIGDDVSGFSVMKDPGLPMTYTGSIAVCVGLTVMFYSRTFSRGHPGVLLAPKEQGAQT